MGARESVPPAGDGLLVVDKPGGWTSHDVVARCRRLCATRRVGHAGTLDPMATGVLLVGVGRATRLLGRLTLADKAYAATIRLGQATVTDDAQGDVTLEADASGVTDAALGEQVRRLTGAIDQRPSAVSAVKIDGQRAYRRVRAGESVDLPARRVVVSRFDVLAVRRTGAFVDVDVEVECGSGTYVRALARDLGAALGVGGHLTALRRTRVGRFPLDEAVPLEDVEPARDLLPLGDVARRCFPVRVVDEASAQAVRHGRPLPLVPDADDGIAAIFAPDGEFLALYEPYGPLSRPVAVFTT